MTETNAFFAGFVLVAVVVLVAIFATGCGIAQYDNDEYWCQASNKQHEIYVSADRDSTHSSHDTSVPNVRALCKELRQNPSFTSYEGSR